MSYQQEWIDRDGHRLGLHRYPEPDIADAPLVVLLPAMGTPARYYRPFAAALRDAGLAVVVAELRGTGGSTPAAGRDCGYGYAELVDDVGAVLDAARPGRPDAARPGGGRRRTVLLGHSLGGQLGLLHLAATGRDDVDRMVLVASGLPYWRSYPGLSGWAVLSMTHAIYAVTAVLGFWPGWGFGGRQARGVVRDWASCIRTGRFPALGGVDPMPALARLALPVLGVSVDGDRIVPAGTVDYLCGLLPAAPVRRSHHSVAGGPLDHFRWTRGSESLARQVAAFAAQIGAPRS